MPDEIVGNGKWLLKGTVAQNAVLRPVFEPGSPSYIAFPWERLGAPLHFPVPIRWGDLNQKHFGERAAKEKIIVADASERRPLHPHLIHGDKEGHAISRPSQWFGGRKGRFMTAGVFWLDGRIKIDIRLARKPDEAREVLASEIAHAVDYGLPLTKSNKAAIMRLMHSHGADEHTWWESDDYNDEYYTLVGESWMSLFIHSYSGIEPEQGEFTHKSTRDMAPAVHRILGISPVGMNPTAPELRVRAWRTRHGNAYAELAWNAAKGKRVVLWRNGVRLTRTKNDGRLVNFLGTRRGTFSYVVVDEKGQRSNEVTVTV